MELTKKSTQKPTSGKKKASGNKMGTAPVKRLLLSMGIPMIISMALQALYNIVDSYFVSCMPNTEDVLNMGDCGANALTLAFPIQMLMVAIGVGTGVGVNAILSRSLGEGDREKASRIAGNSIFLGIGTFIVFLIFGVFGVKAYIGTQTSDAVIFDMASEYLTICCVYSFGISMYMTYEKLLQATGRTVLSTIAQISGALTNIVLDPIMIFGLAGVPQMGIAGAAYATIIGQFVSFLLDAVFHYLFNKKDFDTHMKYMLPQGKMIAEIYRVGIPAIIMQALMSFMTYGVNIIFNLVSASAVTAYGLYYKIQQFVFFSAFGMNNAMIPVIAFNYGKKDQQRVNDGIRYGMLYTLVIMAAGLIVLQTFAYGISDIFAVSDQTKELTVAAIRIITVGYLFVGANIAYQGIFQALDHGVASLVLSFLRLIIVALPVAFVFTMLPHSQYTIWWAFPIAEFAALIYAVLYMRKIRSSKIDPLSEPISAGCPEPETT
ncbi:MAG: MATE family efflux transporter [Clostridia bacterium]|nr:MATE family efflux transporter [Clostridia bacterium]